MTTNAPPNPCRILVLVDDLDLAEEVRLTLSSSNAAIREARTPPEAVRIIAEWAPQVAVLDLDHGGAAVLTHLEAWSALHPAIPVLALTGHTDLETKLAAFTLGVDDILVVPFAPPELLARVLVLMRRRVDLPLQPSPVARVGELEINVFTREVRLGTALVHLSGIEQSLLCLLVTASGQVVTRGQILAALWGADVASSNLVDRHVRDLRAKLGDDWRRPRFIATARGGYSFITGIADYQDQPPLLSAELPDEPAV